MNPTYGDLKKTVIGMKGSRTAIQIPWDFYRNDVGRPPYFPYGKNEEVDHYRERLKIGVRWCGAIADRMANYFCTPPIKALFSVKGSEDNEFAQEAAAVWAEIAKYNQYDQFRIDNYTAAGVGGNSYPKERFRYFDEHTGNELKTLTYRGRVIIDRVNEVFMYRPQIGSARAFVEAWIEEGGQHRIFDDYPDSLDTKRTEYLEAIVPAVYDTTEGVLRDRSSWTIWRNKDAIWGPLEIPYRLPIQRFANLVSRPESENGVSDIAWEIPLNNLINHVITGAARSIQYHGEPKLKARGVSQESDIKLGTDMVLYLPETGASGELPDLDFLVWDQNISGAQSLYRDATGMISALCGMPQHMLQDLEGAGKVVAGVALRIMYATLNQVCVKKEAGFKGPEIDVIKAALSQLAYYNGFAGRWDEVDVDVQYNPDRTPKDEETEFDGDNKKKLAGVFNLVDLVMKHIPDADTREKAMKLLEEKAAETKKLRELGLLDGGFTWNDQQNQADQTKQDQQGKGNDQGTGSNQIPAGD